MEVLALAKAYQDAAGFHLKRPTALEHLTAVLEYGVSGMQITQREVRGVIILDLEGRLVLEDGVTPFVELMNALGHRGGTRILLNFAKGDVPG